MGKIVGYIVLVALVIVPVVTRAQNILTTFGVTGSSYKPQISESIVEIPAVDFLQSGNQYNNFELTGIPGNDARSLSFGWESILEHKKNLFYASVGFGFYSYSYGYRLTLKDTLSSQDFVGAGRSDQMIWDSYVQDSTGLFRFGITSENIYQISFGGGYGRSLLTYRGFELALSAKFRFTYRTEPKQDFSYYTNADFVVRSVAGGTIKNLNLYLSPGFSIRKNANILTFNTLYSVGDINKTNGLSTFKDYGNSVTYTRILGVNKLAKDQYIADSDFAVPDIKSKNYRKGDKSIYIQQLYGTSQFAWFLSSSTDTIRGYDAAYGDVNKVIDGYKISISNPYDVSFNKHFTDRWMLGIQLGTYREIRSPYGVLEDTLGGYIKDLNLVKDDEFSIENLPEGATSTTSGTFSITNAFYISRHTLPVDPFVQVTLKGAVLPAYSEEERRFEVLTDRNSQLLYFTAAVGGDVRFKIRNSRYLLLSGIAEYAFHPNQSYFNAGIRIGYYKNKKFKLKNY